MSCLEKKRDAHRDPETHVQGKGPEMGLLPVSGTRTLKQTRLDILEENLSSSAKKLILGRKRTFQQDNNTKRPAKITRDWFSKQECDGACIA